MNKLWLCLAPILVLSLLGCFATRRAKSVSTEPTAVLVGAGDIADCRDLSGAEATAKLLDEISGTVMAVGDLAYPDGTKENFQCYDKTWGRSKSRTRPAPGNHFILPPPPRTSIISAPQPATRRTATTATN